MTKLVNLRHFRANPMKKNQLLFGTLLFVLAITGCRNPQPPVNLEGKLVLPSNKVWAHRVNDTLNAQSKAQRFDGLELDLIYSSNQNQLFVCHNDEDTLIGLTLSQYLGAIGHPENNCFWLDIKNLDSNTADAISALVRQELEPYGLVDRAFLENSNSWALQKVRDHGLHTSLWVDNFYWSSFDTAAWVEKVNRQIDIAHPDALSCEYRMFGALTEFFADQNIFLWHTPAELTPENAEMTRTFCRHPSVKIVLVDYDEPIDY